jgi:phosphatidylglycerophosphatase A
VSRFALALATWFGCGYFPWGPGTAGSLAAVLIVAALHFGFGAGKLVIGALVVVLLWPGIWASTQTARLLGKEDPGMVVVDEVLGQWLTILGATAINWKSLLSAFLLFRIFDIWKPWPVGRFEALPEGTGIVADDLAAGLFGAIMLYIGGKLGFY